MSDYPIKSCSALLNEKIPCLETLLFEIQMINMVKMGYHLYHVGKDGLIDPYKLLCVLRCKNIEFKSGCASRFSFLLLKNSYISLGQK